MQPVLFSFFCPSERDYLLHSCLRMPYYCPTRHGCLPCANVANAHCDIGVRHSPRWAQRLLLTATLVVLQLSRFIFVTGQSSATTATRVTLCATLRVNREQQAQHAAFATEYYASEYPNLNVSTRLIGQYEATGTTARTLTRSFIINGSDCDMLIGPGASGIAVTMNPVMDQLWVDYSATAVELSEKVDYPYFNRVAPSDAQSAEAMVLWYKRLGWKYANVICADNAYGRSVSNGFAAAFRASGGVVGLSTCVSQNADVTVLNGLVQQLIASGIRNVFVGMTSTDAAFTSYIAAAVAAQAHRFFTTAFSESPCSNNAPLWRWLPGSFCGTYNLDAATLTPFLTAYARRDTSETDAQFAKLGWPTNSFSRNATGIFQAFAADAARFALLSYSRFVSSKQRRPANASEIALYARAQTVIGGCLTGDVVLNAKGDRAASNMYILGVQPDSSNTTIIIANVTGGNVSAAPAIYYNIESRFGTADDAPIAKLPSTDATGTTIAIATSVSAGSLVIVLVFVAVALRRRGRDNSAAPCDDGQPFVVVFTDIQASTTLWSAAPMEMGPAVDRHHQLMRELIADHHGYEVKTIGDSFMVAFRDIAAAVAFACGVQDRFYNTEWSSDIFDQVVRKKVKNDSGVEEPADRYDSLWNGLRVRVGVHYGRGTILLDPVTQSYDYYGTVVNTAARIEGVAHGGQVLLSQEAWDEFRAAVKGDYSYVSKELGPQPLRGLPAPVQLIQLLPVEFADRTFPQLRLDVEITIESAAEEKDEMTVSQQQKLAGSTGSRHSRMSEISGDADVVDTLASKHAKTAKIQRPRFVDLCRCVAALVMTTLPIAEQLALIEVLAGTWRVPTHWKRKQTPKTPQEKVSLEREIVRCIVQLVSRIYPSLPPPHPTAMQEPGSLQASINVTTISGHWSPDSPKHGPGGGGAERPSLAAPTHPNAVMPDQHDEEHL